VVRTIAFTADETEGIGQAALARSGVVGVLPPGVTYHMMEMTPKLDGGQLVPAAKAFRPALVRRMIDRGMRVALSADYNSGMSPTPSMQSVTPLAARLYRLGDAEIRHMATINAPTPSTAAPTAAVSKRASARTSCGGGCPSPAW
jgi:imidazolonepropionase-like amidohydrolase